MRPIYKVKNNKLLITPDIAERIIKNQLRWDDLLVNHNIPESIIEYIDAAEQNSSLIAVNHKGFTAKKTKHYKYTHCEIHPSIMFGVLANNLPLIERNQAPRNQYSTAQAKQALGIYATNFRTRMDSESRNILYYPQKALVKTHLNEYYFLDKCLYF